MSVFENVMLGVNQVYFTASKAERRQMVEYYLSIVGIARAFALQPKMLPLAEPFGMLDSLTPASGGGTRTLASQPHHQAHGHAGCR